MICAKTQATVFKPAKQLTCSPIKHDWFLPLELANRIQSLGKRGFYFSNSYEKLSHTDWCVIQGLKAITFINGKIFHIFLRIEF